MAAAQRKHGACPNGCCSRERSISVLEHARPAGSPGMRYKGLAKGAPAGAHLDGADLLATAVDELLDSSRESEVTLLVQLALVSRVEPTACRGAAQRAIGAGGGPKLQQGRRAARLQERRASRPAPRRCQMACARACAGAARTRKCLLVGLGVVLVAGRHVGPADAHLAHLPCGHRLAALIQDAHLRAAGGPAAKPVTRG